MNFSDLAPIVAIDVMGAPLPLVTRKLAETANEFYRLTRAWEHRQTQSTVPDGTALVPLTPPADTVPLEVTRVRLGAEKLWPRTDAQLEEEFGQWETAVGRPRYYRVEGSSVRLIPAANQLFAEALRIHFTVAPPVTANSIDDEWGLPYQDALIDGARARLLVMPKKDWTDTASAVIFQEIYMRRLNEVRLLARNAGTSEVQLRALPRFR
jgi:hypothetical protein